MLRRATVLTTITVAALIVGPTTAQAVERVKCSSKAKVSTQLWCGKENVRRGTTTLRFLNHNKKAGTKKSRHSLKRSGKYLVRYGNNHIRQATTRNRPPHYYGWLCIHSREGAWNDPNAPYYGGLQMSYNWMNAVPGGDAGKLPAMQQMWIAERVSAQHGFSYSWMKGQWPNTYPPCASYF
jgi:hypothetical protein